MHEINETHDRALASWVESASSGGTDFPIQNLPFGIFRREGKNEPFRGGVAIGDQILDIAAAHKAGAFSGDAASPAAHCTGQTLNGFMAMGPAAWSALRLALSRALREGSPMQGKLTACLVPQAHAEHAVPAAIGDFTDFYASVYHATTVGKLFRPDNPLLPNYKWVPIGYHGRASSIGVSAQAFPRPVGQTLPKDAQTPVFGPSRRLDYELEVGVYVGVGNELGQRVPLADAEAHVFGLCLLNDWSARDIQGWEYQPLGPFLAKSFATTVSPWIVTLEALAPYRTEWTRPVDRSAAAALSRVGGEPRAGRVRRAARGVAGDGKDARRAQRPRPPLAIEPAPRLLDRRAAGDASHRERLQPPAGRPARHRHAVGPDARGGRLAARAFRRGQAADRAAARRDAHVPSGRRCGDPARLVREDRLQAHRLRRVPGDGIAGRLTAPAAARARDGVVDQRTKRPVPVASTVSTSVEPVREAGP